MKTKIMNGQLYEYLNDEQCYQRKIVLNEIHKLVKMTHVTWGLFTKKQYDFDMTKSFILGGVAIGGGIYLYKQIKKYQKSQSQD